MAANGNSEDSPSPKDTASESVDPKKQAMSALSQPNTNQNNNEGSSLLPPPLKPPSNKKKPHTKMHPSKKYLHARKSKKNSSTSNGAGTKPGPQQQQRSNNNNSSNKRNNNGITPAKASASSKQQSPPKRDRYASMLPPPLRDPNDYVNEDNDDGGSPSDRSSLSSWEQFLGAKRRPAIFSSPPPATAPAAKARAPTTGTDTTTSAKSSTTESGPKNTSADEEDELSQPPPSMAKLPSIHDLFPPDLSSSSMPSSVDKKTSIARSGPGGDSKSKTDSRSSRTKSTSKNKDKTNPRSSSNRDKRQRKSNTSNRGPATPENERRTSNSLSDSLSTAASSTSRPSSSKKQQQQPSGQKEKKNVKTPQQDTPSWSSPPKQQQQQSSLEGVLPVSDLFYRSAQSMDNMDGDDEELPFSAEQSDQLAVDHNKVKIRRNQATESLPSGGDSLRKKNGASGSGNIKNTNNSSSRSPQKKKGTAGRRRMVRRGMEMLVGGVAINADPPQRNIELWYDTTQPWYAAISVNSRDFGPFFHSDSQHLLSRTELGLFCEFFVHYAMKWDVCPKELRSIVEEFLKEEASEDAVSTDGAEIVSNASLLTSSSQSQEQEGPLSIDPDNILFKEFQQEFGVSEAEMVELKITMNSAKDTELLPDDLLSELDDTEIRELLASFREGGYAMTEKQMKQGDTKAAVEENKSKGFGKQPQKAKSKKKQKNAGVVISEQGIQVLAARGDIQFVMGITHAELESAGSALDDVWKRGIMNSVNRELQHASLRGDMISGELEVIRADVSTTLSQPEIYDGQTSISLEFSVHCKACRVSDASRAKQIQRLTTAMERAIDDGELHIALAAAAKEEERWSTELRERIYEEFLFEEDEEDNVVWDKDEQSSQTTQRGGASSTSENSGIPERDDQLMFGSSSGVTWDYSHGNSENAPFKGKLGPRLLEAMEKRTKEHPPKVIAVGDVHGCVDELQDLLRQCEYYPGDLLVFLGDLVSKGPDSISVVQMSREIGAIGVRGNHDFEVIRWHQAIKSGTDVCQCTS